MKPHEPPCGALGVRFGAAGEEALHEFAPAIGAAERPPLYAEVGEEGPEREGFGPRPGDHPQDIASPRRRELGLEFRAPPDFREREGGRENGPVEGE